jgi:hypothetical protein
MRTWERGETTCRSTPQRRITRAREGVGEALTRKDATAATRLTDFPCIVIAPQGLGSLDERTFANMVKRAPYSIEHVYFGDDAKVRLLGDDVAIVADNFAKS